MEQHDRGLALTLISVGTLGAIFWITLFLAIFDIGPFA